MDDPDLSGSIKEARRDFQSWPVSMLRHRMIIVYLLFLEFLIVPIFSEIRDRVGVSGQGLWDTIAQVFSYVSLDNYILFFFFAFMSPADVIYLFYKGTIPFVLEVVITIVLGLAFWSAVIFLIVKCKSMPMARLVVFYFILLGYFWASLEGMLVAIMRFMTV